MPGRDWWDDDSVEREPGHRGALWFLALVFALLMVALWIGGGK